jgi:hypothetical protein
LFFCAWAYSRHWDVVISGTIYKKDSKYDVLHTN